MTKPVGKRSAASEPVAAHATATEKPWLVDGYVSSLTGASEHTRDAYAHDVAEFVAWCGRGDARPTAIDRRVLRRYLGYLDTRGFARASIARKAAAMRSYLRYLRRHGVIDADPGAGLRSAEGRCPAPAGPALDEANALLDARPPTSRAKRADGRSATTWRTP